MIARAVPGNSLLARKGIEAIHANAGSHGTGRFNDHAAVDPVVRARKTPSVLIDVVMLPLARASRGNFLRLNLPIVVEIDSNETQRRRSRGRDLGPQRAGRDLNGLA